MKHRSTHATVLGATLLLVGVAGVATASAPEHDASAKSGHGKAAHSKAVKIKKNSVTTRHIKNGTVQSKDLSPMVRAAIAAAANLPTPEPTPPSPYTPPKAYFMASENSVNIPFDSDTDVATQVLPAGTYAVQANLTLYATQSGIASCSLLVNSDSYNFTQHTFPTGGGRASISLSSVVGATESTSPTIQCWVPGIGNASEIRMSAIQVTLP